MVYGRVIHLTARLERSENHDHDGHNDDHRNQEEDEVLQDPGQVSLQVLFCET